MPSTSPLSGWAKEGNWRGRNYSAFEAKRGIGYKTTPSKPDNKGFRALARIENKSAAGKIYEWSGRVHPNGREQLKRRQVDIPGMNSSYSTTTSKKFGKSNNPEAGSIFVQALNQSGPLVNAYQRKAGQSGRASRKMIGRGIYRAWAEDQGRTNAAVVKAIEESRDKFYKAVGYR
jgi:hypothetical protein